jgi:hypothetical protein
MTYMKRKEVISMRNSNQTFSALSMRDTTFLVKRIILFSFKVAIEYVKSNTHVEDKKNTVFTLHHASS